VAETFTKTLWSFALAERDTGSLSSDDNPSPLSLGEREGVRVLRPGAVLAQGTLTRPPGAGDLCPRLRSGQAPRERCMEKTPGVFFRRRRFAVLPGKHFGGPDGMDFDSDGNLLATNWGAGTIDVFARNSVLIERLECPFDKPSNVHFGGPDGCDLYVTEHTTNGLWRTRWRYPGQPTIR